MKEGLKRTFIALIMAVTIAFAFAAIPAMADETGGAYVDDAGDTVPTPIVAGGAAVVNNNAGVSGADNSSQERSGMSFGGVFLMVLLAVVINAALSFAISNRFYKMSKKDSHLQAEIRALRRDIDEKFSGNVTQIKEKSAIVRNNNRNYSKNGGIAYKEEEASEALSEIAKKWNIQIEEETEPKVRIKNTKRSSGGRRSDYQQKRAEEKNSSSEDKIDADADVSDSVKNKAKKFLGDIFPFEEE